MARETSIREGLEVKKILPAEIVGTQCHLYHPIAGCNLTDLYELGLNVVRCGPCIANGEILLIFCDSDYEVLGVATRNIHGGLYPTSVVNQKLLSAQLIAVPNVSDHISCIGPPIIPKRDDETTPTPRSDSLDEFRLEREGLNVRLRLRSGCSVSSPST